MKTIGLTFLLLFSLGHYGFGQSCCSGGVPVSSNLGLPAVDKGVFQVHFTYDLNVLNTVQTERGRLEDDSRNRSTHSLLLELGYNWSARWSTDFLFSFLRQSRTIQQNGQQTDFDEALGIGDAVLLTKYQVLGNSAAPANLHLGLGAKIPLGSFSQVDERGIVLSADLQPGSGAWDFIFWGQFTQQLSFRPSLNFIASSTFAWKGENPRFRISETYSFGNEWLSTIGLSDRILLAKQIFDPSVLLRYRSVAPDFRDGAELPSTGGEWLFINPGISWWLKDNFSLSANATIPVYAHVVGTQATPSYRFNIGLYWRQKK